MKINEFRDVLKKKNCNFAFFYNSDSIRLNPNMFYFSGYSGLGALIVPKNQAPFLIVPKMELEKAEKSEIKIYGMDKKKFFESIYETIKRNKLKMRNITIDKNNFTLNSYKHFKKYLKKAKIRDISLDCSKLREIKTEKEMHLIKKSCNYADKILQKLVRNFRRFKTESEASAFLEYEAKRNGLGLAFNPIVASGVNGSIPHHEPSDKSIKKGFCVIDFGVRHKGYCSDITRTIYVGKPSKTEREIYNRLLTIQEDAINQIKNNKKCSELYDFVIKNLGKYKNYFTHGLGHGVGVEIHELPNLTLNSKDRIKNNMIFTIEPGIYISRRFGIRIEDTILFKNKPIVLTKTSKDLLIV